MANYFDQFDEPVSKSDSSENYFDRFDVKQTNNQEKKSVKPKGVLESAPPAVRYGAGALENILGIATGTILSPIAGMAGAAAAPFAGLDTAADIIRKIQSLSYTPKTKEGQQVADVVSLPFQGIKWIGEQARGNAEGDIRDLAGTTLETALEFAPALLGVRGIRPSPVRLPSIGDPRRILAERRVLDAVEPVPASELTAAVGPQRYAASRGQYLSPSQALSSEFPTISALEAEIRGSTSPRSREYQARLAQQPAAAADISERVARNTQPYVSAPQAAQQLSDAAKLAIGEIERIPNAITQSLYDAAARNPNLIPATEVNSVITNLRGMVGENVGRTELTNPINGLIARIQEERLAIQPQIMQQAGRPVPLADVPLPTNVANNIYRSFSSEFRDIARERPSSSGGVEAQVSRAAGLLEESARQFQPELRTAANVQRALRPDFSVSKFDPLERAARGAGDTATYIARNIRSEDPQAFRTFANQIAAQDINAMRDGVGHYVAQARNKAFSSKQGFVSPSAGIDFADALTGTANRRESFRIALETAARGTPYASNPTAFANGVLRMVDLTRNLSKQVGTMTSRAKATETGFTDPTKAALGHALQSRSAITNMVIRFVNRLSDDFVAEILLNPDNVNLLMNVGSRPQTYASNIQALSRIAGAEGAVAYYGEQGQ